jgi:hypothetical protein
MSKFVGDNFVAAGRSSPPPDLVRPLRPHLHLPGEFLRLLEFSTVSLLPIMLAALIAVHPCRSSSPTQCGGTSVPSQRPPGSPRSSASNALVPVRPMSSVSCSPAGRCVPGRAPSSSSCAFPVSAFIWFS